MYALTCMNVMLRRCGCMSVMRVCMVWYGVHVRLYCYLCNLCMCVMYVKLRMNVMLRMYVDGVCVYVCMCGCVCMHVALCMYVMYVCMYVVYVCM